MTEKSVPEIGPIVASSMIAIGLATVIWAVATNPRVDKKPDFHFTTSTAAPSFGPPDPDLNPKVDAAEADWEATLVDVEKIKTDGLVTEIDIDAQVATVSSEKWSAVPEERRREIGKHLAFYCGRISGSDKNEVEIKDENGKRLETYQRD